MTMVESNPAVYRVLLENAGLLKADKAQLLRQDAMQFLAQNQNCFDVVFLDPPFDQRWLSKVLPLLATHLADDGVIYAESERLLTDGDGWQVIKHGKAGNVHYHLLKSAHGT